MCHPRKLKLTFALCMLLQLVPGPLKAQVIVRNETEIPADQVAFRDELLGLRTVSPEFFEAVQRGPTKAGIPAAVFVMSASATPAVQAAVSMAGKSPRTATVGDWYLASKTAGLLDVSTATAPAVIPATVWPGKHVPVDAVFVASLPDTELFKAEAALYTGRVKGYQQQYLRVNPKPLEALINSYHAMAEAKTAPASQAPKRFNTAIAALGAYPFMAKAATFSAGQITFGQPIVYTAQERKLVVPAALSAQSNVYWVELAVSFRDIEIANAETFIFRVSLPSGIIALELIPLRFDKQASVTRRVSSPEIKAQLGDKAVELGKVYEQEVVYTSLKPIVVADGLQESEFAWSLSDEAIQHGARRFIAVIQVPKGRQSVTAQLQASVKTKGWFAQGDLVSTPPKLIELRLR